jgi:hypothetical protein
MPRRIQKRRGRHFREAEGIFEKKWLALDSLEDARLRNGAWSIPERPGFRGSADPRSQAVDMLPN